MIMKFEVRAIGHVEGAREKLEDDYWGGQESCIILSEELPPEALQGIESFSHVDVLFLFDRVDESKVVLGARHPRNNRDWPKVGIFAQRANPSAGFAVQSYEGLEGAAHGAAPSPSSSQP